MFAHKENEEIVFDLPKIPLDMNDNRYLGLR